MSDHVLIMSLGPVQGLIAQARRTRDLWFGSFVLSELSKAAAKAVAESGGADLVFPAFSNLAELEPEYEVRRDDESKPASVANKIVAIVHAGHDPREVALKARDAARNHLVDWGTKVFDSREQLVDGDARAAALEQLETLLEIRASWAEITADCRYKDARQIAERELAARKTLHTFHPWKEERRGCFKSSLDGARPTVLKEKGREGGEWTEYRIGLREELDAIGLLKRTGGKTDQFIPVPNVGLAAWLDRAHKKAPKQLSQVVEECKPFQRVKASLPWVEAFPYDAQVMLPERWEPYFLDHYVREPRPAPEIVRAHAQKARAFGKNAVQPLLDELGPPYPYPYVACLVADGDGMGPCIDALAEQGWERHRKLSEAMTEFARDSAHRIVERSGHRGVLIYAGGDDVLAFVCVQDALACARELKDSFQDALRGVLGPGVPLPTLSVGIGIGHVMQSLGRLLELGRQAEKLAKTPGPVERTLGQSERNAVALVLEKHSGTTWSVRLPWDGDPREGKGGDPLTMMQDSISVLESERLGTSKIHQMAQMLRRLPRPDQAHDADVLRVLHEEVRRVLSRAEQGALSPSDVLLALDDRDYARSHRAVERWIQRMLIANELRRARQAAPKDEEDAS